MKDIGGVSPKQLKISFANVLQRLDAFHITKPGLPFVSFNHRTPSVCLVF